MSVYFHYMHFLFVVALQLEDRAVKCPIFTPNGKTILWLERKAGGPHASCMSLVRTPSPLTEQVRNL